MKKNIMKTFLYCALGLMAILGILSCSSARAVLYWEANTADGTSVFNGLDIDEPGGTVKVVSDPLGQYGSVYQFYLPDETNGFGKERTESSGTETNGAEFLPAYNTEYYIGWRAMWNPMPIDPGWVALMQMHGYGVSGQGAPLVLRAVNGDGNLYMQANANGVDTDFWHMTFHTNVWQGFVLHVFLSTNPAVGYCEIWVNGEIQTNNAGTTRWYTPTWDNADGVESDSYNKLKWGVYRSGAMDGHGPADAYMSGGAVGSTYADVDPGIGGSGPDFSISDSPSSQTVTAGGGTTYTTTVTGLNGFSENVSLSVSGLPSGASGNFNPSSISTSGTSTLTVTTSSSTPVGTYTLTITGTDTDGATHNSTVSLTVKASNPFSGEWQIENSSSGYSLNVQGAATTNGAPIIQWSYSGSGNELWTFIATSNGYYQINSVSSGKDIAVQNASTTNEAKVIQWSFGSAGNDQWEPVLNTNGTYTLFNLKSGKVLDDPGDSKSAGTQMDQYTSQGNAWQQWNLISQ